MKSFKEKKDLTKLVMLKTMEETMKSLEICWKSNLYQQECWLQAQWVDIEAELWLRTIYIAVIQVVKLIMVS